MSRDTDVYDLFVSYARADNSDGWISGFLEALQAEHHAFTGGGRFDCFFDRQEIRSFDDWRQRIFVDGLARSRLLLAFVSPRWFASEWCRREWKAWIDTEIAKHILTSGSAIIHVVEVPGLVGRVPGLAEQTACDPREVARRVAEACRLPSPHEDFIATTAPVIGHIRDRRQVTSDFARPLAEAGLDALRHEDLRKALANLARDLDGRARLVAAAAASESSIPPYNKRFSGRLDELLELRQRLKDDQAGVICGVHGLGGVGKTELAFTYSHAYAGAYPGGRFLVPCEGQHSLRDAVLVLGNLPGFRENISDRERMTPETHFAAVSRCLAERLSSKGHVLLVLDNVSDAALVGPDQTDVLTCLGSKLHLLATTRMLPAAGGNWLTLGELHEAEALDLLERHRPFAEVADRESARRIVRRLGGFALAIELVAAWLEAHPGHSYTALVDELGLEDLETLAGDADVRLRRHNHERRLSAVLGPVLASLEPPERRALEYAALLAPDQVPLPWLRELVAKDFPDAVAARRHAEDPWSDLCRRLERLALCSRGELRQAPRIVRVHRLVQDLVRRDMQSAELWAEGIRELAQRRAMALTTATDWQACSWEVMPLEALALRWDEEAHPSASWLLGVTSSHWYTLAQWTRAEPLMRRALSIDEAIQGKDHPAVATRLNDLAQLMQSTNRHAEAEPLMRRALSIDEASQGKDHPTVAIRLSNLAGLLRSTNRHAEAEPLMRRALSIDEVACGKDHHHVAIRLSNLAGLLKATNRLAEAEPLIRRALAIEEANYGKDHPDVAICLNNLAQLLEATNRLAEAEPLMRRALSIAKTSFGEDHPRVAIQLGNLAALLLATKRLTEAEPLMRRALSIYETSYGKDHPQVAAQLNNLGQLLASASRRPEAEPLMRRALSIDEASHGKDHPIVANRLSNLAGLLHATNRYAEAEPLMRRALSIDEASLGKDHPLVAVRLNNLAVLLLATNRLEEAELASRRHLEIFLKLTAATGHPHPHLDAAFDNHAELLAEFGRSRPEIMDALDAIAAPYGLRVST